jgi:hypothetical protein
MGHDTEQIATGQIETEQVEMASPLTRETYLPMPQPGNSPQMHEAKAPSLTALSLGAELESDARLTSRTDSSSSFEEGLEPWTARATEWLLPLQRALGFESVEAQRLPTLVEERD